VTLERSWKWGAPVQSKSGGTDPARSAGKNSFVLVPPLFVSKSTISRFGERCRDGQYSLVSLLFAVLLLTVPPCPMESAPLRLRIGGTRKCPERQANREPVGTTRDAEMIRFVFFRYDTFDAAVDFDTPPGGLEMGRFLVFECVLTLTLVLYMGCSDVSEFGHIYGQIFTTPSCVYDRLLARTRMVDFNALIV